MEDNYKNTAEAHNLAATKIQARFRGYRTRKGCRQTLSHSEDCTHQPHCAPIKKINPHTAATRIQATFRGYETRKHIEHGGHHKGAMHEHDDSPSSVADSGLADRLQKLDMAATKIQAGVRGYQVRKTHAHPQHAGHPENPTCVPSEEAAIDTSCAATRIQAGYRGYKTRKALGGHNLSTVPKIDAALNLSEKGASPKNKHESDTVSLTSQIGSPKEADQAATVIQAGVRGYLARKRCGHNVIGDPRMETLEDTFSRSSYNATNKENDPERAATKIQATYRGYRTRKHGCHTAHETRPDASLL